MHLIKIGGNTRINATKHLLIEINNISSSNNIGVVFSEETFEFNNMEECESETDYSNINYGDECFYYNQNAKKIIIWTYHLSEFAIIEDNQESTETTSSGSISEDASVQRSSITQYCSEEWECTSWTECNSNEISTRICTDNNKCKTAEKKPKEEQECEFFLVDKSENKENQNPTRVFLFDIIIELLRQKIKEGEALSVKTTLINFGSFSIVETNLTYTIKDNRGLIVYQKEINTTVDTQKEFIEILDITMLKKGSYTLETSLFYPEQKEPAIAEKSFTIGEDTPLINLLLVLAIAGILLYFMYSIAIKDNAFGFFKNKQLIENNPKTTYLQLEVPEGKEFVLNDGYKIYTLNELVSTLMDMNMHLYKFHVTAMRNDFYNWIKDVFQDNTLAERIRHSETPKIMAEEIIKYLG
jgi:hypothetical protein